MADIRMLALDLRYRFFVLVFVAWFYVWNILIAVDQLANALLAGDPDDTISSRAGKGKAKGQTTWCLLCKVLDWFDKRHCETSVDAEEGSDSAFERAKRKAISILDSDIRAADVIGWSATIVATVCLVLILLLEIGII